MSGSGQLSRTLRSRLSYCRQLCQAGSAKGGMLCLIGISRWSPFWESAKRTTHKRRGVFDVDWWYHIYPHQRYPLLMPKQVQCASAGATRLMNNSVVMAATKVVTVVSARRGPGAANARWPGHLETATAAFLRCQGCEPFGWHFPAWAKLKVAMA